MIGLTDTYKLAADITLSFTYITQCGVLEHKCYIKAPEQRKYKKMYLW